MRLQHYDGVFQQMNQTKIVYQGLVFLLKLVLTETFSCFLSVCVHCCFHRNVYAICFSLCMGTFSSRNVFDLPTLFYECLASIVKYGNRHTTWPVNIRNDWRRKQRWKQYLADKQPNKSHFETVHNVYLLKLKLAWMSVFTEGNKRLNYMVNYCLQITYLPSTVTSLCSDEILGG